MEKIEENKGITLITLVITIVILLILSSITIIALSGDNGLFTRAQQAKKITDNAQEFEEATLSDYNNKIDEIVGGTTRETNYKGNILWKNENRTDVFESQTVTLNDELKNYDYIKIFFLTTNTNYEIEYIYGKSLAEDVLVLDDEIFTVLGTSWYNNYWAGHPLMYRVITGKKKK